MQLIAKSSRKETKPMFRCAQHAADNKICTHYHFIYYDDLTNEIKTHLTRQIERLIDSNAYAESCENTLSDINRLVQKIKKDKLQKELLLVKQKCF